MADCMEAFAAVDQFEHTHGLVLPNMSPAYIQQRPGLISRLLDYSSKLGLRDEVVHDAVLLMVRQGRKGRGSMTFTILPICPSAPPCPILPCPAMLGPTLPCPTLLCPACPTLPALPCPALPCPALPCPAVLCLTIPCPVSCHLGLRQQSSTSTLPVARI